MEWDEALANKKDDKTRKEFEKWAVLTYSNNKAIINEKKGSDAGIDGIAYMADRNDKNEIEMKQVLFSVKSDKNPHVFYIRDFYGAIERDKAAMGYFITLYPPTKDMVSECKKLGKYKNQLVDTEYPKIEIVTVEDILATKRITIPMSHQIEVVKSAKQKSTEQEPLF
ncbi:restriction endonuclease [Chloroflexota bacterium]